MKYWLIIITLGIGTIAGHAQVSVTTDQSKDKSQSSSQISVTAGDHTFVPLTVETKKTTDDANTTRTESTTKALLNNGSYFDWRSTVTETKKLSDGSSEKTSETVEKDRQGQARVTKSSSERITKESDGTVRDTTSRYRRDSSGRLVVESETSAISKTNPDGSISTIRTENKADTSGSLKPVQRVAETATKVSGTETRTDRTVQTFNHIDGGFSDSARETVIERKDATGVTTETLIQKSTGAGTWQNQGRVVTTESRSADGSIQRETVEQVRPAYVPSDRGAGTATLEPRQKTVEREVRQPDGSTVIERQIMHRDINGNWRPDSFSTEGAQQGY